MKSEKLQLKIQSYIATFKTFNFGLQLLILHFALLTIFLPKEAEASFLIQRPLYIGLTNGLVGYWTFDGGDMAGERAFDRSGNANTGTLTNGPTRAIGRVGQALSFDGSNDYVDAGTGSNLDAPSAFTLGGWVRFRSTGNAYIIGKNKGAAPSYNYQIQYFGGVLYSSMAAGSTDYDLGLTWTPILDRWYHIVANYDGTNQKLYLDGSEVATSNRGALTLVTGSTFILNIGRRSNSTVYFNGLIDEVRIYNRALSADEIKRLYNIGATLKINKPLSTGSLTNGLVGHWTFDGKDMAGERAYDLSGNSNTGTLTNGPTRAIGRIGQALSFDGVNDLVNISHTSQLEITGDVSISVWIFWRTTGTNNKNVFAKGECFGAVCPYRLEVNRTNQRVTFIHNDGTAASQDALNGVTNSVPPNTWIHVVVTRNTSNTTRSIYINGTLSTGPTAYTKSPTASNDPVRIGNDDLDTDQPFNGLIDEVRIYNRALSADEIKRLYNIGATLKINKPLSTGSLTNGLVGHWTFDGKDMAGERAYDLSGNSNTGTLTNGPTRAIGRIGQALSFDGSDDWVSCTDANCGGTTAGKLDMGTSDWTASLWVNGRSFANNPMPISKMAFTGGTNPDAWYIEILSGGTIDGGIRDANSQVTSTNDGSTLSTNRWYHVVVVWDRDGNMIRYLDGSQTGTQDSISAISGSVDNTLEFRIGARDISGNEIPFNGLIDEVRIYNRALSADEVRRLYNMGR